MTHLKIEKKALSIIAMAAVFMISTASFSLADQLPVKNVDDLKDYITDKNPYTDWQLWPGTEKLYEGTQPHGAFLTTYVNDIALERLQADKDKFPNGSIVVKENYNKQKELAAVTAMYKVKDYNPSDGDWYWIKYLPNGEVEAEGKVGSCIRCHSKMKSKDWVFTVKP
ncbi:MAG: cytochrome P460 family protein [Desulfurivibrionaceae bacterium]